MKGFKTIFIANLSEIARPLVKLMNKEKAAAEVWEDHWLCDRFLFSDSDDRVLITPVSIDKNFFQDSCRLLGYNNTVNWFPKKVGESICEAIIEDKELLGQIVGILKKGDVRLCSYGATPEFTGLVWKLREMGLKFLTPEMPAEEKRWVADFFGSKAGFRQAISFLGKDFPAMPQGGICSSLEEAVGWATYLLQNTAGCVIKANRGLAGAGLRIIKKGDLGEIRGTGVMRKKIEEILKSEAYWRFGENGGAFDTVVVEEFIPADPSVCGGNPNIELKVDEKGIQALYPCGMRVTPEGIFRGVEIGKGAVQKKAAEILLKSGQKLGEFLGKMGYRGYFEIDYIPRSINEIYPIEANLRRTGGTHVHEAAERLLGKDYQENYYVTASNIFAAPKFKGKNYSALKEAVKEVLYPIKGQKEGVILTVINLLKKGQLGYVAVGENKEKVAQIEKEFSARVSSN